MLSHLSCLLVAVVVRVPLVTPYGAMVDFELGVGVGWVYRSVCRVP